MPSDRQLITRLFVEHFPKVFSDLIGIAIEELAFIDSSVRASFS